MACTHFLFHLLITDHHWTHCWSVLNSQVKSFCFLFSWFFLFILLSSGSKAIISSWVRQPRELRLASHFLLFSVIASSTRLFCLLFPKPLFILVQMCVSDKHVNSRKLISHVNLHLLSRMIQVVPHGSGVVQGSQHLSPLQWWFC